MELFATLYERDAKLTTTHSRELLKHPNQLIQSLEFAKSFLDRNHYTPKRVRKIIHGAAAFLIRANNLKKLTADAERLLPQLCDTKYYLRKHDKDILKSQILDPAIDLLSENSDLDSSCDSGSVSSVDSVTEAFSKLEVDLSKTKEDSHAQAFLKLLDDRLELSTKTRGLLWNPALGVQEITRTDLSKAAIYVVTKLKRKAFKQEISKDQFENLADFLKVTYGKEIGESIPFCACWL